MDSHNTQRYVNGRGYVQNEGDVQVSPGGSYLISRRSIVPRREEVENLLVPVAISSSHIAYGSIRMEPVFMILGQTAATLAVQSLEQNVPVQDVPYAKLKKRLLADGQVVALPANSSPKRLWLAPQLRGQVADDGDVKLSGPWVRSTASRAYVGRAYFHDGNREKGKCKAVFDFATKPGDYEVRISYTPHPNRASNVPIAINHAKGVSRLVIDQQIALAAGKPPFVSMGKYAFGEQASIVVSNQSTDGYVVVDAVQLLPSGRHNTGQRSSR